jgi:hypothetical protein
VKLKEMERSDVAVRWQGAGLAGRFGGREQDAAVVEAGSTGMGEVMDRERTRGWAEAM